ncbi:hypothetical protein EDC04DRAFT_2723349 [Pisolithus marmoratus]|nr:hypothetical protein EDC04DRAFT_2723349 [Pisolithus marmoratus]
MGMDYDAESDNEFNQPIYEEAQTGLKHKQSDHDDNSYVTSSEVEDFNDGYEDHELQFRMGPAKDLCVKMTNDEKKVKVKKDMDQELGQVSSMTTRGKASKCHCQKNLPSVLTEDRVWSKIIMPALLIWAGSLADPWMISDDKLMQLLQTIIMATFPDFPNLDEICPGMLMFTIVLFKILSSFLLDSCLLGQVSQRLCQWCSNFGSTAITVISHFLVLDLNSAVPSPPKACASPNTLKLIFEDLKRTGIKGVLALTCTALHHTLTLYNEGMLDLDVMVAPRKAKMALKMNKATGKELSTALMVSEQNCSSCTRQYADAIAKHDDATLCEILVGATILTPGSEQVISEEGTVQSEEKDTATLLIANLFEIVEMVQE